MTMNRPITSGANEKPAATDHGTFERRAFSNSVPTAARQAAQMPPRCLAGHANEVVLECFAGDREPRRQRPDRDQQTAISSGASSARDSRSSSTSGPAGAADGANRPPRSSGLGTIEMARPDFESPVSMAFERVRIQFLHQAPTMHDPDPRCESFDLAEDVARHEHGHAVFDASPRINSRISMTPAGSRPFAGSSSTSSSRLGQQRPRQREALQVALRQRARSPIGVRPEPQPLDGRIHRARIRHPGQAARDVEILADAELRVRDRALDEVADPPPEAPLRRR